MELNKIKKYKGQLVLLTYNGKNPKKQTGKITAITNDHILFKINGEYEKPIQKENIKEIESIKTFSHYVRTIKRYLSDEKPQNALDICDNIQNIFKLPEQIKEIEQYKKDCIEILWKKFRPEADIIKLSDTLNEITNESK